MQLFVIDDICCPNLINSVTCGGQLELEESKNFPRYLAHDQGELLEGRLICKQCNETFPVIGGLPILVVQPWLYLRDNYETILTITTEAGMPISQPMVSMMRDRGVDTAPMRKGGNKYDLRETLSVYLCQHYDTVWEILPANHPILKILHDHCPKDFYSMAIDLLAPFLDSGQEVLDIGCGVGRSVYEFSLRAKLVYGIEYSYASAFLARRILRHSPSRLESYKIQLDGDIYSRRALPNRGRDNVEIIVASGDNLPFPTGVFDITSSWNVIDRVPSPEKIITEQERTLKLHGIISVADPYSWDTSYTSRHEWLGGQNNQRSIGALSDRMKKTSDILQEEDYIPWLSWKYERNFSLFYCHALIGRKRATATSA